MKDAVRIGFSSDQYLLIGKKAQDPLKQGFLFLGFVLFGRLRFQNKQFHIRFGPVGFEIDGIGQQRTFSPLDDQPDV